MKVQPRLEPPLKEPTLSDSDSLLRARYDFLITSDGSGYHERCGGWGAVLTSEVFNECRYVPSCGCCTHTETGRAEFMAILTALHSIVEVMKFEEKPSSIEKLEMLRPSVCIVTDREDLAKSIMGEYNRGKNLDLWYQFSWYEQYFDITAIHQHRNTTQMQKQVDLMASTMRIVLIDHLENQKEASNI